MEPRDTLRLLALYAHPDDEVFAAGGTLALLSERGVEVTLAVATGGEKGEVVNPELQGIVDLTNLPSLRKEEQRCAAAAMGIAEVIPLGYRDSGMEGTDPNHDPEAFINVADEEVVKRLVGLMRTVRPQVVITFDETGGYGHPDHIKIYRTATRAFDLAGRRDALPEEGSLFAPSKLYYPVFAQRFLRDIREEYLRQDLPLRFGTGLRAIEQRLEAGEAPGAPDDQIGAVVDISSTIDRKMAAFRCYATQMSPDFFYFSAPRDILETAMAREYFIRVRSSVKTETVENDLFAGIQS